MDNIRRWWWPAFVLLYPLVLWPLAARHTVATNYLAREYLTVIFLGLGLLLELLAHPTVHFGDVRKIPSTLKRHPALALLFGFGLWALVAAMFTSEPAFSLLGSKYGIGDGALMAAAFSLVGALVYLQALRDHGLSKRISWAVIAGAVVLALMALSEMALKHGLVYDVGRGDLPLATFSQRGHLAGYLVLGAAALVGFHYQRALASLPLLMLVSLALGLTQNRAAMVALFVVLLLSVRQLRKTAVALMVVAVGIGAGYLLAKAVTQSERALANTSSFTNRTFFWKAAVRGVADKPIFGWGAGQFDESWYNFMNRGELSEYLRREYGVFELLSVETTPGTAPIFAHRDDQGKVGLLSIAPTKAHNQFLDIALLRGLPALAIYVLLLLVAFSSWRQGFPGTYALLAVHVWLMLWFAGVNIEAPIWVLIGSAAAVGKIGTGYRGAPS